MQISTAIETVNLTDELYVNKKVSVTVARLDKLHPIISGNKYFKLKYNIENSLTANKEGILTFGGAYSNHLAATAFACNKAGIKSVAIVRGEVPPQLNHTLIYCKEQDMQLEFVSRTEYTDKEKLYQHYQNKYPGYYLVPEGGDNEAGEKGCAEILNHIENANHYSHIVCDIGTGTTFKGIVKSSSAQQTIIGIVVLKGAEAMNKTLADELASHKNFQFIHDYHFGGYAKKTEELIHFMNRFYQQHKITTDFVYTAKQFYAVNDLIARDFFPPGSKILCLHTGGLQGNLSLPEGTLIF
ncbi:MAG: pyridoxal-phosphate dependent enzyme [Sphingobacteriales bacterium]|nr:MAG: pyridoxal-phosphate dependent enzyme [Sphingobacteriales bacterium]